MAYPNFNEEKKLWRRGFEVVVGLDEAGRGPLAGPVIAAAVTVLQFSIALARSLSSQTNSNSQFSKINDSKKLSEKQREFLYEKLTMHPAIEWGVGIVSEKVIDKINILEATKLAMQKAVDALHGNMSNRYHKTHGREFYGTWEKKRFLLIDGNFKVKSKIPQSSIIKGDQKVFSIAAASIIAKVTRDRLMQNMHKKYPGYGFDRHKGYGTAAHLASIKTLGPCKIHRRTFYPMSGLAKKGEI